MASAEPGKMNINFEPISNASKTDSIAASALIVSFPSGHPATMDMELSTFSKIDNPEDKCLVAQQGEQMYRATNVKSKDTYRSQVAVFNKSSRTVRFLNTAKGAFPMKRVVGGNVTLDDEEQSASQKYFHAHRRLIETFGAEKNRKVIADQRRRERDQKTSATDGLMSAVNAGAKAKSALKAAKVVNLPPFHTDAKTPEDIYVLNDLIPSECFESLSPRIFMKALKDGSEISRLEVSRSYPRFVTDSLHKLSLLFKSNKVEKEEAEKSCRILVFLTYLFKLANAPRVITKSLSSMLDSSDFIADHLSSTFAESEGKTKRSQTKASRAKLLYHICILSVRVCGFKMKRASFDTIAKDLNLIEAKLKPYFVNTGCRVAGERKRVRDDSGEPQTRAPAYISLTTPFSIGEVVNFQRKKRRTR
eukprot:442930_1